jgi:hypothetical protein
MVSRTRSNKLKRAPYDSPHGRFLSLLLASYMAIQKHTNTWPSAPLTHRFSEYGKIAIFVVNHVNKKRF